MTLSQIMSGHADCGACGARGSLDLHQFTDRHYVKCGTCHATGPSSLSIVFAIEGWTKLHERTTVGVQP